MRRSIMRRLSLKSKRGKSGTASGSDSEANGVARISISTEYNAKMKKGKENEDSESHRRGAAKKRSSRGRYSQKEVAEDSAVTSDVEDTRSTDSEEESQNVGKPGSSKKLKKDDQKATPSLSKTEENDKKEYEVEKIVGQRTIKGRRQFLVRWKGYGEDSDTWEQEKDLHCAELIEEYLSENVENEEDNNKSKNSPKSAKNKAGKAEKKPKKLRSNMKKQAENGKQTTSDEEKGENQKEFEVERIVDVYFKKNKTREFLIRWKGFTSADDTWEPEENLNCPDLITKFMQKVEKAKTTGARELRTNRPHTKRYTLSTHDSGRRLSRRNMGRQRAMYHECDS